MQNTAWAYAYIEESELNRITMQLIGTFGNL